MKKTLIKFTIWSSAILTILVIILAVHIYLVTQPKEKNPTLSWQLARIDINESIPLSKEIVSKTYKTLKQIKGIQRIVVNSKEGNVVIAYFPKDQTQEGIYSAFEKNTDFTSVLFTPSDKQLAAGCPVLDKNSISYKLGSFFEGVFQNQ
tara:strand:+ start:562 stop:1008 length:447 start_codon:yes stop_codon:yes gene_type:complete